MRVSLSKGYVFVPEWEGNKKLPEENQIKVHCEFLRGVDLTATLSERDPEKPELFYAADFKSFCKRIENLEVDGKDCTPEDVALLPGLAGLYSEIRLDFNKRSAVDKKK